MHLQPIANKDIPWTRTKLESDVFFHYKKK
jgi:hypothetical protein